MPIIIGVVTVSVSSLFQYVSWLNSVKVQNATDVTANAERAYEKAADAIGVRQYSTIVFRPALKELIQGARTDVEAAAKPGVEGAFASAPPEISLLASDLENKQQRFSSYFQQLKAWNENYDRLLTDIDYSLDRPVFEQAAKQVEKSSYRRLSQIDCSKSLTQELQRLHYDPSSLKIRFAGINKCFRDTHWILDEQLTAAKAAISLSGRQRADGGKLVPDFSEAVNSQIKKNFESLHGKANVFRCYALRRIEYYRTQKELSILSLSSALRWLSDSFHEEAKAHFDDVARNCDE